MEQQRLTPEQVYGVMQRRTGGDCHLKPQTLIRIIISIIVIILASLLISTNELKTIKIGTKEYTGGGVRQMEARGFAIPFLVAAVVYLIVDTIRLMYPIFRQYPRLPEDIQKMSFRQVNQIFDEESAKIIKKYKMEDILETKFYNIASTQNNDEIIEQLYQIEHPEVVKDQL